MISLDRVSKSFDGGLSRAQLQAELVGLQGLLGLTVEATIIAAFFVLFNAMFQHANIATPQWIGYFIQRPESHNIHHQKGVYRYNYADLPLIDIMFGTFRNPRELDDTECGFYDGASARIVEMLIGRDVSAPTIKPVSDGQYA